MILAAPIAKIHTRCSGCGCFREIQWQVENKLKCDRCIQIMQLKGEVQIPTRTAPATTPAKTPDQKPRRRSKPYSPKPFNPDKKVDSKIKKEVYRIILKQDKSISGENICSLVKDFRGTEYQKMMIWRAVRELESEGLIVANRYRNQSFIDKKREHLLKEIGSVDVPFQKTRDKVFDILKMANKPLSVADIYQILVIHKQTLLNSLKFFVAEGWCDSCVWLNPAIGHNAEYFALFSNQNAYAKLQQLKEDEPERRLLKALEGGAKNKSEIALAMGYPRHYHKTVNKHLEDLEKRGLVVSFQKLSPQKLMLRYYGLTQQRMEA